MNRCTAYRCVVILFSLWAWSITAFPQSVYKEIEISGLEMFSIYEAKDIIRRFKLDRLRRNRSHFRSVEKKIDRFYHKQGYTLAKTFLIGETPTRLQIYVDEGRLGKVIFKRLGTIDTLKMIYEFSLKHKVYHKQSVNRELTRLKKKYGFKKVYARLVPSRVYDESLFQLDREYTFPGVGTIRLPYLLQYGQRYDLKIFFVKKRGEVKREFTYGFGTSYTKGIIPWARYRYPSLISEGDRWEIGSSMGIYYGFDLKYTDLPRWTFMEANTKYYFTPTLKEYFTPLVKGSAYRSRASRGDIGLSQYEYLMLNGTVAPGITLFKRLRVYAGYGGERVYIYDSKKDPDAEFQVDISEDTDFWHLLEFSTELDLIPWTLKRTVKREIKMSYLYYFNRRSFHEFFIRGDHDYEFENFDIYSFAFEYAFVWRRPPFYHEPAVSGSRFKGFMGKEYHSRKMLKVSNEYRISLYRDFVFGGLFVDFVWFEGSGYDLFGDQYGIVGGISGHIIFLDQFEFNLYYGKDYLRSTAESQYNLTLGMEKKW